MFQVCFKFAQEANNFFRTTGIRDRVFGFVKLFILLLHVGFASVLVGSPVRITQTLQAGTYPYALISALAHAVTYFRGRAVAVTVSAPFVLALALRSFASYRVLHRRAISFRSRAKTCFDLRKGSCHAM